MDVLSSIVSGMPGRYASALFELAGEAKKLDEIDGDLGNFEAMLEMSDDLVSLVRSPVYSASEQSRAIDAVLDKAKIGGLTKNFIALVTRNRRLFAITDMIKAYRALLAHARHEISAEVVSATRLTKAQTDALKDSLKSAAGNEVRLETRVDSSLLGGLVVRLGSRMIDTSLKTKLDSLRIAMKEVG